MTSPAAMRNRDLIIYAGLLLAVMAVYAQILGFEFVGLDDPGYVTRNSHVLGGLTGRGFAWAFTTTDEANWHPLTWLSLMLDAQLGGSDPRIFHLTNLLLHAANTLILFHVLAAMTGFSLRSALVAALFAVHPLHVESVAWVAERKDVMSTLFWLVTMLAYWGYVRWPGPIRYALVFLVFALGLMAKPMLVTLPIVLLVLDYWPLGRWGGARVTGGPEVSADAHGRRSDRQSLQQTVATTGRRPGQTPSRPLERREELPVGRPLAEREGGSPDLRRSSKPSHATPSIRLLLEKAPLFALSAVSSAITLYAQSREGAVVGLELFPFPVRVANAAVSYSTYLMKMIWPSKLAVLHPYSTEDLTSWRVIGSGLLILIVSALVVRLTPRHPYLLAGWLWYLVSLLPVIGLVQVGAQSMADRYTYVPLIGPFIMIVWGASDFVAWLSSRREIEGCGNRAGSLSSPLAGETVASGTLASVTAAPGTLTACTPSASMPPAATPPTRTPAVRSPAAGTPPTKTPAAGTPPARMLAAAAAVAAAALLVALAACAHVQAGRWRNSHELFTHTLAVTGPNAPAQNALAFDLYERGFTDESIEHYREALRIWPAYPDAHVNLAAALVRGGRTEEAIPHYREALRRMPRHPGIESHLAAALIERGDLDEAASLLEDALRRAPEDSFARQQLGLLRSRQGRSEEAVTHLEEAARTDALDAGAHVNLGTALMRAGNLEGAAAELREALRLEPGHASAHKNLGVVLAREGRLDEAIVHFSEAVRLDPSDEGARRNLDRAKALAARPR